MVQHGLAIVSLCDAVWPHNPDIGSQIWDLLPATALCVGWREGRGVQSSAKWVRSCSGAGLGSGDYSWKQTFAKIEVSQSQRWPPREPSPG